MGSSIRNTPIGGVRYPHVPATNQAFFYDGHRYACLIEGLLWNNFSPADLSYLARIRMSGVADDMNGRLVLAANLLGTVAIRLSILEY